MLTPILHHSPASEKDSLWTEGYRIRWFFFEKSPPICWAIQW